MQQTGAIDATLVEVSDKFGEDPASSSYWTEEGIGQTMMKKTYLVQSIGEL